MMVRADTPQGRRRERVGERLRQALTTLEADPDAALTPSALARLAGVGRNTLYANHRPILDALAAMRTARAPKTVSVPDNHDGPEWGDDHVSKIRALATQNAGLLQRALAAERRVVDLEERNAELAGLVARLRKPAVIDGNRASPDDR